MHARKLRWAAPLLLAGTLIAGPAYAAGEITQDRTGSNADAADAVEARETLDSASALMDKLKADPDAARLLSHAKGILLVPNYARGGLVAGGSGGDGVMVEKTGVGWTAPRFYNVGSISVGAQAGFEKGGVAFLLMSDKAAADFGQQNNFSLNAEAGYRISDAAAAVAADSEPGDIVVWSDTKGAFAGATVGVSDVNWDDGENQAYYGKRVTPADVAQGRAKPASAAANPLRSALGR
jgi:SH3 domain-containing YSC84-like protein 1